ncbi:methyltransferase [Algoriphagus aquimarinus]|uniref:methyltransferase n=1 Tax=Algoriphagus aquimarinus TaxID=237018 RepID=UPI0030DC6C66|tara:strand:+ start:7232 stop:8272 length:1041 start_codon:yes stop_codon:yes gene_type:complete
MENTAQQPNPENIWKIGSGFMACKTLLAAVNFQLFTKLAAHPDQSARALKSQLNLNCTDRHFFDFLDTLTGFGFLSRTGILDEALYSNSIDTEVFLDKNKPSYIGGILEMMNKRLYGFWGNLEEGLKTGTPQNEAKHGVNIFKEIYKDPEILENFVNGMTGVQLGNFMTFAKKFDFSPYKTLTDAGGSAGYLSLMVAKENPHMTCTCFDLPPVEPIAKETIKNLHLEDRVKAESGNFFVDPIPAADIIAMGNILHDWDESEKLQLLQKAYDTLPEGGVFVAIENIIDDERKHNLFGMMMSLNMMIETAGGFDYTFIDFNKWANSVGFKSCEILPLAGPASAAIAYK